MSPVYSILSDLDSDEEYNPNDFENPGSAAFDDNSSIQKNLLVKSQDLSVSYP
jgi:hypothetical protein